MYYVRFLSYFSTPGSFYLIDGAWETRLALAAEGVCCFYGFLTNIRPHQLDAAMVYVMPSYIEHAEACTSGSKTFILKKNVESLCVSGAKGIWVSVSKTMNSTTLQLVCRTKIPNVPCKVFQGGRIVWWAGRRELPLNLQCGMQMILPGYPVSFIDEEENSSENQDASILKS